MEDAVENKPAIGSSQHQLLNWGNYWINRLEDYTDHKNDLTIQYQWRVGNVK